MVFLFFKVLYFAFNSFDWFLKKIIYFIVSLLVHVEQAFILVK